MACHQNGGKPFFKIVPLETNVIHHSNPKHQRFYGRNTFENSIYETTAIV